MPKQVDLISPGTRRGMFFRSTAGVVLGAARARQIPLGEAVLCRLSIRRAGSVTSARYTPKLNSSHQPARALPYDEWMNEPVIRTAHGSVLGRERLIRIVANQEGGAHFDSRLDAEYQRVAQGGAMGWRKTSDGLVATIDLDEGRGSEDSDRDLNPVPATIRQIAHEVLESLRGPKREFVTYRPPHPWPPKSE
ncbi:MAG: hypothetical protein GEU80_15415 [Dehalococcoidia bacterium]|nr:hypothetical protein [Dehalococcoidia bacterium]